VCGIIGLVCKKGIIDRGWLSKGRAMLLHRGPDDSGEWWSPDGNVGFGHQRLAIIDLSHTGHQPMEDGTGQYVAVLNGEIYNYIDLREDLRKSGHLFHTCSDTEVLLEAYKKWGTDCLEHLTGAFAFAIYDGVSRTLFLARDRAGEKPLFYKISDDRFVFSSELKALMADPDFSRKLDLDALDHYFAYGYVHGEQTILKGTYKLLPGHAMLFNMKTHSVNIWRYWALPENSPLHGESIENLTNELEIHLVEAVRRQLVADVPIGILLSGGLDSSLVTAIAARSTSKPIKTFTISFPGHSSFNEGPYAKLVADFFGTDHNELVAEPASISLLPQLARQFDEPIADHSIVPTSILANLVGKSVKVALGGDGGDELFGGYSHYTYLQKIERLRYYIPEKIRNGVSLFASYVLPVGTRGRNHLIGLRGDAARSISAINLYFDEVSRRRLLSPLYANMAYSLISPESKKAIYVDPSLNIIQNIARTDFYTTLADDYLVKSDRASMLHSLELRSPFLDHKLIEFAFERLPDSLRATLNERKILLRRLGKRMLPKSLDIKRKQGFSLPLAVWFKGEWGKYMKSVLMESDPMIFDRKVIEELIKAQFRGFANADRLFALTMFELWRREYKVTV